MAQQSNLKEIHQIRQSQIKRLGNHFVAAKYADRFHLLPTQDKTLIEELIKLESLRPPEEQVQAYAKWKANKERIRKSMRQRSAETLKKSRLMAMTTLRAVYTLDLLRTDFPADLIIFDESSQVGQAPALALLPLGKKVIFTGDTQQLAPIVKSKDEEAQEWLGKSMFVRQKYFAESTCFLAEQSRMAEPICQLVSKIFYQGRLKVAGGCGIDWHDDRDIKNSRVEPNPLSVRNILEKSNYSTKYGGFIRYQSAKTIHDLVLRFLDLYEINTDKLLILTPFRAQRRLIRSFLKKSKIRGVKVSTVHRAQGGECHTVIFDPVDAENDFLQTEDAVRLINVALSRAQARLIICISDNDLNHPVFKKIRDLTENMQRISQKLDKINNSHSITTDNKSTAIILDADFPRNSLQKEISIHSKNGCIVGKITDASEDGATFKLFVYQTGEYKTFKTEFVKRNAAQYNNL